MNRRSVQAQAQSHLRMWHWMEVEGRENGCLHRFHRKLRVEQDTGLHPFAQRNLSVETKRGEKYLFHEPPNDQLVSQTPETVRINEIPQNTKN